MWVGESCLVNIVYRVCELITRGGDGVLPVRGEVLGIARVCGSFWIC